MLILIGEDTQKHVTQLLTHYSEQAQAKVEALATITNPEDMDTESFDEVVGLLNFAKRLRCWEKLQIKTTICVDTRYLDDKGFPKEFAFRTEYGPDRITNGGLINHGTSDNPRWQTHT
ncbi:hypothetical protein [Pseudoalteromonas sp.]|uniref:hypothetical protein n=1 Tax=Pseudoalteromonas sp. TaxID=53249 RepID=UPI00272B9494|nr:hypothetical protein [Pseudoalteromonas sp.]